MIAESRSPRIPPYFGATYSPDGTTLVALATGNAIDVLDARTLQPVGGQPVPFTPPESPIRYAKMTPDGRRAVVVLSAFDHDDTRISAIDLDQRQVLYTTSVDIPHAANNALSPDGHTVALVSKNTGKIELVDADNGQASPPINSPDNATTVSFAPDGATLVTADDGGGVHLWTTATRQLIGTVEPLGPDTPATASFIGPGRVLIAYLDGDVFEWDTNPNAWEAQACAVAGRNLTQAEWATLFPNRPYQATCPQYPPGT
jgi:WD40 repeat protein